VKILAIESSCDETAAAVLLEKNGQPLLLSNVVASQIDLHAKYGGVVPEVAARSHIEKIIPVITEALIGAKTKLSDIDYIAVTSGPGLVGSLVVGVETAKALGLANNIPVIPLNHLEGHIYANFLLEEKPSFPIVALLVSGGHTLLVLMKNHFDFKVIGKTRDDAAGEAFDKGAKLMDLGYPGGPIISKLAEEGDSSAYDFPLIDLTESPKKNKAGFMEKSDLSMDYSFSGLKTALLNKVKAEGKLSREKTADMAASYEKAIIANLSQNAVRAVGIYKPKSFILSGGVAANKLLRTTLEEDIKKVDPKTKYLIPPFSLCTDNAGMMAACAYYKVKTKKQKGSIDFVAEPTLEIK
jgi:N6-L-threonylcarbamoyladenine synthase